MARLANDLWNIGASFYRAQPAQAIGIGLTVSTLVLATSSSLFYKATRWTGLDKTDYVSCDDLPAQIDRLATDRVSKLKGALAPAHIYDRRGLGMDGVYQNVVDTASFLKSKGITVIGTAGVMGLFMYSYSECMQFGDPGNPNLSEQCWSHLGSVSHEPSLLSVAAAIHTAAKGSVIPIILGTGGMLTGLSVVNLLASGSPNPSLPAFLRERVGLMVERYTALAKELDKQWKEAEGDAQKIEKVFNTAKLLERRMSLIKLSLEENLNISSAFSSNIVLPIEKSVKSIIAKKNK